MPLVLITHLEKIQLLFLQVLLPLGLLIKCFFCNAKYRLELGVGQIGLGVIKMIRQKNNIHLISLRKGYILN